MSDADGEVVYDLDDWEPELKDRLDERLDAMGIDFAWEGPDLVVAEADAERVEALLDELEDEAEDRSDDLPEPADDEAPYEALADLYLAADRLEDAPDDPDAVAAFVDALAAVDGARPPYGVSDPEWARITELAAAVRAALEPGGAGDDAVASSARALRDLLHRYV